MDYRSLSKTLSHALRHEPWLYELELDDDGWTSLEPLLSTLRMRKAEWRNLGRPDLEEMISRSAKKRFEISGNTIRAFYGHSVPGKLRKLPARPPDTLFHGTAPAALDKIGEGGLKPMSRQYVHLSTDEATAREVGARKTARPVILNIDAAAAHASGVLFYEGNDSVWLADEIPPEFVTGGELRSANSK